MKPNSSLGDLRLAPTRDHHSKYLAYPVHFNHQSTTTKNNSLHIEHLIQQLSIKSPLQTTNPQRHIQKCNSQTNIAKPTFKFQITSPGDPHQNTTPFLKAQPQNKNKGNDKSNSSSHKGASPFNILKPVDRNIVEHEQPKKHKILFRKPKEVSFKDEFRVGKMLGKGRFGNVYSALHVPSQFFVAVKEISLQKMSPKIIQRLVWQIKIQSFLRHPNCLELYKCLKEEHSLYLLLEHGDCSLFDKLRQHKFFTEVETCYYLKQTIQALLHLHKQGIVHRDLKPENIVLVNNVVKLADFGWSIYLAKNSKRSTFCGTLDYVCPEIVMGNSYDEMVDAWSVGVLCYELCTGHAPFSSKLGREATFQKILQVDVKFPTYLSCEVKDFIRGLLTRDPEKRMSLDQAMGHPWLLKYSCP